MAAVGTVYSCANCYLQSSLSFSSRHIPPQILIHSFSRRKPVVRPSSGSWWIYEQTPSAQDLSLFTISWAKDYTGPLQYWNSWTEIKVLPFQMRHCSPTICSKKRCGLLLCDKSKVKHQRHQRENPFLEESKYISLFTNKKSAGVSTLCADICCIDSKVSKGQEGNVW